MSEDGIPVRKHTRGGQWPGLGLSLAVLVIISLRCTTIAPRVEDERAPAASSSKSVLTDGERIHAAAWTIDGSGILIATNHGSGCLLSSVDPGSGVVSELRELSFCPDRILPLRDGSVLLAGPAMSLWLETGGETVRRASGHIVAAIDSNNYVSADDGGLTWVREGAPLEVETPLRSVVMVAGGSVLVGVRESEHGQSLVRVDRAGVPTPISGDTVTAIDSFEVAPDGKELVISATREGGASDVGLLSIDGGEANWIVPERFDETTATWAPRGSKVSWIVHAAGGSVVRTVHVPTAAQLSVDFPWSHVTAIAWEPKAERMVVIVSEPFSSDRLEILRYGGEERRTLLPASHRSETSLEPLPEAGAGVYVTAPAVVRYSEKSPVVIWLDERSDFSWKGGAAAIRASVDSGFVFTRSSLGGLDAAFWSGLQSLPWFDPERVFIVSREKVTAAEMARLDPRVIVIGHAADRVDARSFIEVPMKDDVDSFASTFLRTHVARP